MILNDGTAISHTRKDECKGTNFRFYTGDVIEVVYDPAAKQISFHNRARNLTGSLHF